MTEDMMFDCRGYLLFSLQDDKVRTNNSIVHLEVMGFADLIISFACGLG